MGLFGGIFGGGTKEGLREMLSQGAVVIDVRTPEEYSRGHIEGSKNIPLNQVSGKVNQIKNLGKPVVLCCASGIRSGRATSMLKSKGITCENGGSWKSVAGML